MRSDVIYFPPHRRSNLAEAVAHSKEFAKKVGIPQSVGKDFAAADEKKAKKKNGSKKW